MEINRNRKTQMNEWSDPGSCNATALLEASWCWCLGFWLPADGLQPELPRWNMQPTPLSKVSNLIFSKVSPLPSLKGSAFSQRFSTMLSKVSKQPFLKRSQPFPKGCCSIVKMVYISTTFLKGFSLFPKVPSHGITHQAQGKSCPLLTRDVTKSSIWALLFLA